MHHTPHKTSHLHHTVIRPVLEYGCVLFDNCTEQQSEQLERVQRQAALAITRAYQHTPHQNLLSELGLERLEVRRTKAKLTLFFKMKKNIAPNYLSELIPEEVGQQSQYNLRNSTSIKLPKTSTNYFLKSFIPSTIRLWNELPENIRLKNEFDDFKKELQQIYKPPKVSKAHLISAKDGHIQLLRIKLGLSGLNFHRRKFHFIQHSNCPYCGNKREDPIHFFFNCTEYAAPRAVMANGLMRALPNHTHLIATIDERKSQRKLIKLIVFGTDNFDADIKLFKIIATFIDSTKRFTYQL